MAHIVGIHGIGAQLAGEEQLAQRWVPALLDGVHRADPRSDVTSDDVAIAFYGDLFRPQGRPLGVGEEGSDAVDPGFEEELLAAWWKHAAVVDGAVVPPDARTLGRTPRSVAAALRALSNSSFFADVAMRLLVADLRQVRRYLTDPALRAAVSERLAACISDETRVLVGHSLGSVVAYEALAANPSWPVRAFVSLGSPLGTRGLIFDRLQPAPRDGLGHWPGAVEHWTNVADDHDIVALVRDLRPQFGDRVRGFLVHNGSHAHDASPYLSAPETGTGILLGLQS